MEFNISNHSVSERLDACTEEFEKINHIIHGMGSMSHPVPYLTRYAIVRSCGAIEFGFKTIISDINSNGQSNQVKQFIDKKFRHSSLNPSYNNICDSLSQFDKNWADEFKKIVDNLKDKKRILDSLKSLNEARNSFAHGGTPTATFSNIEEYFNDSIIILECIEKSFLGHNQ